jgi:hypothetical protein
MFIADLLSRNFLKEKFDNEIDIEGTVHCINRIDVNYCNELKEIQRETEIDLILQKVLFYCKNTQKSVAVEHLRY